jgi:hypothetical protein
MVDVQNWWEGLIHGVNQSMEYGEFIIDATASLEKSFII